MFWKFLKKQKDLAKKQGLSFLFVTAKGFKPLTFSSVVRHSIQLSYAASFKMAAYLNLAAFAFKKRCKYKQNIHILKPYKHFFLLINKILLGVFL